VNQRLRDELEELLLVAAGAIPGALLRWQLEGAGTAWIGGLQGLVEADVVANLLGSLLIGVVLGRPRPAARLMLWGAIGFCGSLTTFASWMLQLVLALERGAPLSALGMVLLSLLGGLSLVAAGRALGLRLARHTRAAGRARGAAR
jgi:CrcB protein